MESDEQVQALFHINSLKQPYLKCDQGHCIDRICINKDCGQSSLHCSNNKCQSSLKKHIRCNNISFEGITDFLNEPLQARKQFLTKLFQIQNQTIECLKNTKTSIIKSLAFGSLEQKYQKLIEQIYVNNNANIANGKDMNELYQKLIERQKFQNKETNELVQEFSQKHQQMLHQMTILKEQIFKNYLGVGQEKNQINSKILDICQQKAKKKKFLIESLNYPTTIQLLYRATQNEFSGIKFHQKCDHVQGTLILIHTEFNKIIGGYTPIKWNISKGYGFDNSGLSFIFSLDRMQKMNLVIKQKAICCYQNYGPIFGNGFDICIADKCNQNNNSYSKLSSYNSKLPNVHSSLTYFSLSGSTNGYNFKVLEYQVFRVI